MGKIHIIPRLSFQFKSQPLKMKDKSTTNLEEKKKRWVNQKPKMNIKKNLKMSDFEKVTFWLHLYKKLLKEVENTSWNRSMSSI